MTEWRRHLHQNPELLFAVENTAAFVERKLREFGVDEIVTGLGRTGVVGLIRGNRGPGRTVGLRADMDALPITEASGRAWSSTAPGKMHACGHDGHTAMLLGAAKYLSETRNFAGNVAVIFQPAEEGGGGGNEMVKDGMMERFAIEEVYGMHNMPGMPVGHFGSRAGPIMASTDEFNITVKGRGGHAAQRTRRSTRSPSAPRSSTRCRRSPRAPSIRLPPSSSPSPSSMPASRTTSSPNRPYSPAPCAR